MKPNDAEQLAGIALAEALKARIEALDRERKSLLRQIAKLEELGIIPAEEAEKAREELTQ